MYDFIGKFEYLRSREGQKLCNEKGMILTHFVAGLQRKCDGLHEGQRCRVGVPPASKGGVSPQVPELLAAKNTENAKNSSLTYLDRYFQSSIFDTPIRSPNCPPMCAQKKISFFKNSQKIAQFRKMQGTIRNPCFARQLLTEPRPPAHRSSQTY
jgi:hypothetical protein